MKSIKKLLPAVQIRVHILKELGNLIHVTKLEKTALFYKKNWGGLWVVSYYKS